MKILLNHSKKNAFQNSLEWSGWFKRREDMVVCVKSEAVVALESV